MLAVRLAMLGLGLWLSVAIACLVAVGPARARAQTSCAERGDCYIDTAGQERSALRDYRLLHHYPAPHYLRAAFEETLFLAIGVGWYWADRGRNEADWDFPSARQRFSRDVLRFDNNTFPINFIWHPLSGGAYYMAARTNGMRLGPTILYAVVTSLVWEYGLEFRERVSINDLITTPIAGIALGEVWSRLAWLVNRPGRAHARSKRMGAWTFGLMQNLHERMDGTDKHSAAATLAPWRAFSAHAGASLTRTATQDTLAASLACDVRLVAIPSYLRVGQFSRWIHDADLARLSLDVQVASQAAGEIDLYAETMLAGFYAQQIGTAHTGTSLLIGTGVGYRYRRIRLPEFEDDLSVTHLPGLMLDLAQLGRASTMLLSLRVNADFAGVRAWPFQSWEAAHPDEQTKTVLHRYGYAYFFGGSAQASLEWVLSFARLGVSAMAAQYDSQQGLDRTQERLSTDVRISNTVFDAQGFVRVYPGPSHKLALGLGVLTRRRISQLGHFEQRGALLRAAATLGWEL